MSWLMKLLFGNSPGAQSSEARMAIGGIVAGAGLIYMGRVPDGVHLLMASIGGYAGSRGLAKLGESVGKMVNEREVREAIKRGIDPSEPVVVAPVVAAPAAPASPKP